MNLVDKEANQKGCKTTDKIEGTIGMEFNLLFTEYLKRG